MTVTRPEMLKFHQYSFGDEEINEVVDTLRSGWITLGPKTQKFEDDFRRYIGCSHAVGVYSCTSALTLALAGLGIGPGDEVITTPITFPAAVNEIIHLGGKPVFVDVVPGTLNMDAGKIEEKVTEKTKAILPVHFAGHPCDMDEIQAIAQKHGLVIIEDAAHAIEAEYKGRKIGAIGDATCFSFYATKNITTGEGGMLTTNNEKLADEARALRLHGITRDAWKRYGTEGFKYWEQVSLGYKCNMFDIQAALGIHQLRKVDLFWERRKAICAKYDAAFKNVHEVRSLEVSKDVKSAYHIYVLALEPDRLSISRNDFINEMMKRKVGLAIHFRSLTLQSYYREHFSESVGTVPIAESFSERILTLPLYPTMEDSDVQYVIDMAMDTVEKNRA
ncbi:MAG: DegT/DnrJ/EryC1/StrS family aminotransferase [Nitrospinae bacterium]|nr:DegT/DnrJ/EryC1/StrS family aminotransferase [Nitrospinota bacterium]